MVSITSLIFLEEIQKSQASSLYAICSPRLSGHSMERRTVAEQPALRGRMQADLGIVTEPEGGMLGAAGV